MDIYSIYDAKKHYKNFVIKAFINEIVAVAQLLSY